MRARFLARIVDTHGKKARKNTAANQMQRGVWALGPGHTWDAFMPHCKPTTWAE